MGRKNKALIFFAIVFVVSILFFRSPVDTQTIPTKFVAGENMGFDLGPGNLNFGQIVPGYSASRELTVTNTYEYPTITNIKSSGEISSCIIVSENNFVLQPTESKKLTFSCFAEKGIEFKEYLGKIIIATSKA